MTGRFEPGERKGQAALSRLHAVPDAVESAPHARDSVAAERDRRALERDFAAEERDDLARHRATEEGRIAGNLERLGSGGTALAMKWATQYARAAADRAAAARDRDDAARDRLAAAQDRAESARERELAARELAIASLDELTWTARRGPGLDELEREIERSERTGDSLSIAYLDVDGLKAVNDTSGHPAGDRLLMDVADALRAELRAYDLVVRMGGDEFLCILAGADYDFVRGRFAGIVASLGRRSPSASFSVGFAELEPGESGEALIQRADRDLLAQRAGHDVGR